MSGWCSIHIYTHPSTLTCIYVWFILLFNYWRLLHPCLRRGAVIPLIALMGENGDAIETVWGIDSVAAADVVLCRHGKIQCWGTPERRVFLRPAQPKGRWASFAPGQWGFCVFIFTFVSSRLTTCSHTGRCDYSDSHSSALQQNPHKDTRRILKHRPVFYGKG